MTFWIEIGGSPAAFRSCLISDTGVPHFGAGKTIGIVRGLGGATRLR